MDGVVEPQGAYWDKKTTAEQPTQWLWQLKSSCKLTFCNCQLHFLLWGRGLRSDSFERTSNTSNVSLVFLRRIKTCANEALYKAPAILNGYFVVVICKHTFTFRHLKIKCFFCFFWLPPCRLDKRTKRMDNSERLSPCITKPLFLKSIRAAGEGKSAVCVC